MWLLHLLRNCLPPSTINQRFFLKGKNDCTYMFRTSGWAWNASPWRTPTASQILGAATKLGCQILSLPQLHCWPTAVSFSLAQPVWKWIWRGQKWDDEHNINSSTFWKDQHSAKKSSYWQKNTHILLNSQHWTYIMYVQFIKGQPPVLASLPSTFCEDQF